MNVVPFKAEHFYAVDVQPSQAYVRRYVSPELLLALEEKDSFSIVEDDQVFACFGWAEAHRNRALLWAYISRAAAPRFITLTKIARRMIDGLPYARLEFEVKCDFKQGHRWAKMLGFTVEAPRMIAHAQDGADQTLYARVRNVVPV